jgi:hypothetical protein
VYGHETAHPLPATRELAAGLLAAFTVAALAADAGGYEPSSWGWSSIVVLAAGGAACGLGLRQMSGLEWALPGMLAALAAWGWLSLTWSIDVPETVREGERMLLYVVGAAALLLLGRWSRVEPLLGLVAGAITGVCTYSLATRMFTPRHGAYQVVSSDPEAAFRLARPLGYANALACFAVLGILLAAGFALRGSTLRIRAAASAALVVLFPTLYFTYGRGAWLALLAGLAALVVLARERLQLAAGLLVLAPAPALAVALASRTHGLTKDPRSAAAAAHDGHRLAIAIAVLIVIAALVPAALERMHHRFALAPAQLRALVAALALLAAGLLVVGLVRVGGPQGAVRRAYHAFNAPAPLVRANTSERLFSLSGNSRSEYWRVAWREVEDHPWLGGGAGSYQRFWLRHRRAALPVRNAHSLYLETLAELGPLGLALLLAALVVPLAAAGAARRHPLAPAAAGAYVAFLAHAGIDWDWEMTSVTFAAFTCGIALLLAARGDATRALWPAVRVGGAALAGLLCVLALLGFIGNRAEASAADALDRADANAAERDAVRARRWEPWSGEPWRLLGEAQLEQGQVDVARRTFLKGLDRDAGNWELWLDVALASTGDERRAALLHVARLNPLSPELKQLQGAR